MLLVRVRWLPDNIVTSSLPPFFPLSLCLINRLTASLTHSLTLPSHPTLTTRPLSYAHPISFTVHLSILTSLHFSLSPLHHPSLYLTFLSSHSLPLLPSHPPSFYFQSSILVFSIFQYFSLMPFYICDKI